MDPKLTYSLRLDKSVSGGSKIIEYVGEYVGKAEVAARKKKRYGTNMWYIAKVGSSEDLYVDASVIGNTARFINHSCIPNCRFETWFVDSKPRLIVVSNGPIEEGTLLTLSYMDSTWNIPCECGLCDGNYNIHVAGDESTESDT
jgi:histone-lysine N-methyltransferase SETD1